MSLCTPRAFACPAVLKALEKRGIHCTPGISVEHQHLAGRYVLRGVESGGAVSDMGRACAYVSPEGNPLPWLQPLQSIAVNGRHAIVLADSLVRIEMLRMVRTCELAITLHTLRRLPESKRPEIVSTLLFRGRDGVLPIGLWKGEHKAPRGKVAPNFFSRAGEVLQLPKQFGEATRQIAAAVCCLGCTHAHVSVPPMAAIDSAVDIRHIHSD